MSFKSLKVFQIAKELALDVDKLVKNLPRTERFGLGDQIYRSSRSIVANIAEGYGRRYYPADYIRFLHYSLGSSDETQVHLELIFDTDLLHSSDYPDLIKRYKNLSVRLYNLISAIQKAYPQTIRNYS